MKFPQVLTIFFLISTALGVEAGLFGLARWQQHRYWQRVQEQADFSARPPALLTGTFDNGRTVALTNQPNPLNPEAEVGWRILTPLRTAKGEVIVDRGYATPVLRADGGPEFAGFATSSTEVAGVYQSLPRRHGWLQGPDTTTNPRLLAFLNPDLLVSVTLPVYLIARSETAPALTAVPPPLPSADRHLSYALQWLGMALAFPVLCYFGWRKNRRRKG